MYEKKIEIKTQDSCNFSTNISPLNSNIFFSIDDKGYILSKENFLSLTNFNDIKKLEQNNNLLTVTANDTISFSKFNNNGKKLFVGDISKVINKYTIDIDNNILNKSNIEIQNLKTWKFDITAEGDNLITGSSNLILYDVVNNKIKKEIENKSKFIYSFCFLPNNKCAIGNSFGCVYFFDTDKYEQLNKIEEHCLLVRNLEYNKDKNILYSASDDLHINQIEMNVFKCSSPIIGHKEPISGMIYNEYNNLLFTSSFDGTIKIWDKNGICINTLELGNKMPIWSIGISKEADILTYCNNEGFGIYLKK